MNKVSAVLLASLLCLSTWSESTSRAHRSPPTAPPTPQSQPSVLFQDPMLGTVKMRPVFTPTARFGGAEKPAVPVVALQRPGVSVDQIKTVRPGSWR